MFLFTQRGYFAFFHMRQLRDTVIRKTEILRQFHMFLQQAFVHQLAFAVDDALDLRDKERINLGRVVDFLHVKTSPQRFGNDEKPFIVHAP